jgi:hypothetical protein
MRSTLLAAGAVLLAACSPQVGIQQRCEHDGNAQADCACFAGVLAASLTQPQMDAFARLQTVDPANDDEAQREAARRTIGLDGGLKIAGAAAQCHVTKGWFEEREAPKTSQE